MVPDVYTRVARSLAARRGGLKELWPAFISRLLKESTGQSRLDVHLSLGSPHSTTTNLSRSARACPCTTRQC